ncbi:hypothetical protein RQP46_003137 [Phenoliferia psychrophenolica]
MIEQRPQLNEPEPATPGPTASPPTPATKSSTPALPPELVADIIDLTVDILVKEERDLASQVPITNHFLLSAALVDRTWHSIAGSALLKNGLVTSANFDLFIAQIQMHQLEMSLESVRFGAGSAGLDDVRDSSRDDAQFDALVECLPGLKRLEIVGEGLLFRTHLPSGYCVYDQVFLSNSGLLQTNVVHKLYGNSPSKLVIYENRPRPEAEVPPATDMDPADQWQVPYTFLHGIEEVHVSSNQFEPSMKLLLRITGLGYVNPSGGVARPWQRLRTLHFDCSSPFIIPVASEIIETLSLHYPGDLTYPSLTHLAAHLDILHFFATTGARPSLSSLDVLEYPQFPQYEEVVSLETAERMLLKLVDLPVLAKLKVPACWRSDAVEGACEAKGVDLRWK